MTFDLVNVLLLLALGLVAGALGGLLGIGGSVLMIPVLTLLPRLDVNYHLAQAAAMIVNVFVSAPALLQHHRAGAVDWIVVKRLLPAGVITILIGVQLSDQLNPATLELIFGTFLLYIIYVNIRRVFRPSTGEEWLPDRTSWTRVSIAGGIMGFAAGLLGIGGGVLVVPLLQRLCHMPLRRCIAASAAAMCVTASVGAVRKNILLSDIPPVGHLDPWHSLLIAAILAPTAILGGSLGGWLTHALPLRWVRIALIVLLTIACWNLLRAPFNNAEEPESQTAGHSEELSCSSFTAFRLSGCLAFSLPARGESLRSCV